jgi:hypothetical protein
LTTATHDIRLAAGFEIRSSGLTSRTLDRRNAEALVAALARDLARTVDGANQGMLVGAGGVFESHELLRPGLPVWSALADAADPAIRERGLTPSLLAIGTHQGRMPDQRLTPTVSRLQGQFAVVPLLLIAPEDHGKTLESQLERELFERGSIDPPARALLSKMLGLDTTHGQLLTANDLLALQHVQMDTAGLSGLWPVVEHVLLAPEESMDFDVVAGLRASWLAGDQQLVLHFLALHDSAQGDIEDYGLWLRALRTMIALCDSHAIAWRAEVGENCVLDPSGRLITQSMGPSDQPNKAAQHVDDEFGLIAWSLIESGQLKHVYPLDAETAHQVSQTLSQKFPDLDSRSPSELKP